MFVNDGARRQLLKDERRRFIEKEWPKVLETIHRLGLDAAELLSAAGESADRESEDD
jgi:GntR family transcriptional regulator